MKKRFSLKEITREAEKDKSTSPFRIHESIIEETDLDLPYVVYKFDEGYQKIIVSVKLMQIAEEYWRKIDRKFEIDDICELELKIEENEEKI